jgi:hypothetical protein
VTPRSVLARLLALFRPRHLDRELDAEIQAHIEMSVEENVRAGMSPEEARQMAARSFGPAEPMKEEYRDTRGIPIVESAHRDFRFAIRSLRRSPGFAAIARYFSRRPPQPRISRLEEPPEWTQLPLSGRTEPNRRGLVSCCLALSLVYPPTSWSIRAGRGLSANTMASTFCCFLW